MPSWSTAGAGARRYVRRVVPERVRLQLRLAQNNLSALLVPRSPSVYLTVRECAEHLWRVSEGDREIYVPSYARWWRYRHGIDKQLEQLARSYGYGEHYDVGASDVVVDIGANVGEFSLFAGSRGARVLAVEADDHVFALLTRNTAHVPGITRISAAVWKERGMIDLYSSPAGADSSTIEPSEPSVRTKKQATTLNDIVDGIAADRIHLVKCDAEGAEPEVLDGGRRVLAERVTWIAFDCGPERRGKPTLDTCRAIATELGFVIDNLGDAGVRNMLIAKNSRF